jgi:hypothetical protein
VRTDILASPNIPNKCSQLAEIGPANGSNQPGDRFVVRVMLARKHVASPDMEKKKTIQMVGGMYDLATGLLEFVADN